MAEFSLAHVGINAANADEARRAAALFCTLFGFSCKEGGSSFFAGPGVEIMKAPYLGTHGHIAIATGDVAAARAELEARGFTFNEASSKFKADGRLNAIYLTDEICGFAVHLVGQ